MGQHGLLHWHHTPQRLSLYVVASTSDKFACIVSLGGCAAGKQSVLPLQSKRKASMKILGPEPSWRAEGYFVEGEGFYQ
jgi:hypothetical protein